ncbi:thioredoxin family protein [Flavobacterium sp.]|uniref:thioredoxin family protein n=1 Tax=Flavobacterium sp. TaxID=239 RepID=UPI00286E82AC|nr:thioredoxin family protein [Flavobacterium sp.]
MKILICFISFFWAIPQGFAQLNMVQFEQIDSLQKEEKRNVIVFIHADWCKYCQVMKNKTFKNKDAIKLINEKFYFVDFNAEEKRKIVFNKQDFAFKPKGSNSGIHELAIELGTINNQINYPTLCVLNEKKEIIFQHNSFLNAKDLINILGELKE